MNSKSGIKKVTVVTAFKLEDKELKSLIKKLEKKHNTKLEPKVIVDPTLLGGVRIEIGDQVLDGSIRSRINRLKSTLLS
jgi:F-type H+-transporting ATPase subunit delta